MISPLVALDQIIEAITKCIKIEKKLDLWIQSTQLIQME